MSHYCVDIISLHYRDIFSSQKSFLGTKDLSPSKIFITYTQSKIISRETVLLSLVRLLKLKTSPKTKIVFIMPHTHLE